MVSAKKKPVAPKAKPQKRTGRPVRLDLSDADHERLRAAAERVGLSKASYARQAVFERIMADEQRTG